MLLLLKGCFQDKQSWHLLASNQLPAANIIVSDSSVPMFDFNNKSKLHVSTVPNSFKITPEVPK